MDKVKVLMLGSSENVRGGITTVVNGFRGESFSDSINVQYVSTHFNVNKIYNIIGYLFAYLKVFFIMINSRPDVVHMHMSERGSFIRKYYLFKLCKLFDIPVILHMHGAEFEEYYHSSNPKIQVRIREFLKEARLVVALGERWSEIIKEIEPLSNVQIMYNAVTLPSHEIRIEQNKVVNILFLAVVIERKGIKLLIEASEKVVNDMNKLNKEVIFNICGDGDLKELLEFEVREKKLDKYFNFTGWIDKEQKVNYLDNADIFVLPSYNEGLPLSILEAMSYGIPIIATNVGSIDEAVINGYNGYLIEPGDSVNLANKIVECINSSDYESFSKASRKLAEDKFNVIQYNSRFADLYRTGSE